MKRYNMLVEAWKEQALQLPPLKRWQATLEIVIDYGTYSAEHLAAVTLIYLDHDFSQDKLPKKRGRPRKMAKKTPSEPKEET